METPEEYRQQAEVRRKAEGELDTIYFSLFQNHPDGQRIFQDLSARFYDRTSVSGSPVDAHATMVNEGQRQVVLYVLARCMRAQR